MTIQEIEWLIAKGETQTLELKKTTGELKEAMHTACAFLNSDGGWLLFGIFDDRLEITNPGHFPSPLTPENIKEPHGSYPHNLRIAQVLYLSKYLEGWGTGIRRMIDICREEGVPEPEYKSDGYTVTVTFWKTTQKTAQKTNQKANQKANQKGYNFIPKEIELVKLELFERGYNLTDSQVELLLYLYSHPRATRKSVADLNIGMKEGGIQYNIARLVAHGLLRREGGRKNGRWVVMLDIDNDTENKD